MATRIPPQNKKTLGSSLGFGEENSIIIPKYTYRSSYGDDKSKKAEWINNNEGRYSVSFNSGYTSNNGYSNSANNVKSVRKSRVPSYYIY